MKNDKTDFTQGSIPKKLALFMLPILGSLVLQAAYGVVDLLVVGRFGSTSGLSAVSTGSQVLNLVTFVVTQLAMGVTVLIARYLGEKKHEFISPVIGGAAGWYFKIYRPKKQQATDAAEDYGDDYDDTPPWEDEDETESEGEE